ncbi:amidase family protein [Colletotrichum truncatum]|uniref:Amidase family protein n=1 Tax=Colletotrichum truncatum TaxID=5467 RepID=A0ACC3ZDA6_COLTU|nr:amidase family protein [Colletotrichum truncatum]KAF6797956.1 amidase family protein [Colletotrichum truncatum]
MRSSFVHVAFATCLLQQLVGAYKDAFVVEFDESLQLTPDILNTQVQTSLATSGLDCIASKRFQFTHAVFHGASFDLKCSNDRVSQKAILSTVKSIDGVKQAWPVTSIEPAIFEGHFPGVSNGKFINRHFATNIRGDLPQISARDEKNADTLSTHIDTGVARLHAANFTGSGLRIAVIDSGFDVDVPGLSKVNIEYSHDLTDNDNDVRDNCSFHGTHVLGVVAAKGDEARFGVIGVAPDATYELYRIQPCGESGSTDMLINAFLEAADRGVDVISCSFGGGKAFPEDPWSAVATRLFKNGTYISLPTGNGGPGVFTGGSPGMADAITSIGSTDNSVTPYFTWQGNWTTGSDAGDIRFVPGLPFDLPADNQLTIWSPNENVDVSNDCKPIPDATNLPADLSNTVLLLSITQCWTDASGGSPSLSQVLGIPYVIYYTTKNWTVSDGPGFFPDTSDPNLKGIATVEYQTGVKLLEAFHKDANTKVHLPHEASVANTALENRVNNRTGDLASVFSSWGPTLTGGSMPLLVAPGGNLLSTFPGKLGGYGVVSGTSQSVPFAAGVAALIKQKHPDYTPEEIQAVIATTSRPLKWNNGEGVTSDFLAPVFQQGGGLLDAWNAVHSTTVLSTAALSFNDTTNRPKELTFSIKNTGTTATTYKLSNVGAASGYMLETAKGYTFTKGEATPVYAELSIKPSTIKIEPGKSATVSVTVTKEPALSEAATRVSFFGGFVAIEAEGSAEVNKLTLPYTGFGAPLSTLPIVNRDKSYLMAWNNTAAAPTRMEEGRVFRCILDTSKDVPASFEDNMFPGVWIELVIQTRELIISIVDAKSGKEVVQSFQTSSSDVWGPGNTWYWDGSDGNKAFVPAGTYIWQVKSQRLNAKPEEPSSWEVYSTGKWVLEYASNSTLPSNSTAQ